MTLFNKFLATGFIVSFVSSIHLSAQTPFVSPVRPGNEPMATGKFEPTWQSLQHYEVPEWFRNAKFGIWAHWGPQCQPEQGDWYARFMYDQKSWQYKWHVANYGHPSKVGFKEVINDWKAENWDPQKLVALYKRAGAQYFFAMANHHDNLDLWDSKYQEWNSTRVGPKKDILAGWAEAAKKNGLPFGLSVHAAHFYNHNMATNNGKLNAVLFGKVLTDEQKKSLVWDVERGAPDKIQSEAWQTCTCIGDWHYNRSVYEQNRYKSARDVIHMLVDVVSKNGNLLLNIPVRGDGSIDDKSIQVVEDIARWMEINQESIFDTRPWKVFGEGPAAENANPIHAQGFNEGKIKFNFNDIRYNQKGKVLYATVMGVPEGPIVMKKAENKKIKRITLLGSDEKLKWKQEADQLVIQRPTTIPNDIAIVFKITT